MNLRSALGEARGLGAAGRGTSEWLTQRITALALIPLGLAAATLFFWLLASGYRGVVTWFHLPWVLLFVVLLLVAAFWHGFIGLKAIIEDYVPRKRLAFVLVTAVKFLSVALALLGIIAAALTGFRSY